MMAPRRSREEEERKALKRAEEDLVRLTSETARCRWMERRWLQEKERVGQDVTRTREQLVRQERAINLRQAEVDRARRGLEAAREEGQRVRRILAKEEDEVKKCEGELARARADSKVCDQSWAAHEWLLGIVGGWKLNLMFRSRLSYEPGLMPK